MPLFRWTIRSWPLSHGYRRPPCTGTGLRPRPLADSCGLKSRVVDRCTASPWRTMADVQDDPADELEWDERALDAAAEVTPLDADSSAVAPLRASLHVHTARALYKLGRLEDA